MQKRWAMAVLSLSLIFVITACGIDRPSRRIPVQRAAVLASSTPALQVSASPVQPPTQTPAPNSPVPATETAAPTEAPTSTPESAPSTQDQSVDEFLLSLASASNGALLFQQFQPEAGFACSTCHRVDSEDRLIGPGLLNIDTRAATRVEGLSAVEYIRQSILAPDDYIVADYPGALMPKNWGEIYSQAEIYDIIAYVLTLR